MGALVVAALLVGLGILDWKRKHIPRDAVRAPGTVVDVVEQRSRIAGRAKARLYAPVVSYVHPVTGRGETLGPEAVSFTERRHRVGETVEVAYDPRTGQVVRVPDRPWLRRSILFLLALAFVVLQVVSWAR